MEAGSPRKQKKQPRKITPTYLRNAGLYYLQRYVASTHQFKRAMKRKIQRSCYIHTEQNIEECLEWLEKLTHEFQEYGYLNDSAYLSGMIRSLRLSKGLSTSMIIAKMQDKGFTETQIMEIIHETDADRNDTDGPHPELAAALQFSKKKKIGPYHPTPGRKTPEQQIATLARAGFSYDICKKIMTQTDIKPVNE